MKRKLSAVLLSALILSQTVLLSGCGECDHDWDDWEIEKEATCTEDGLKVRECDECGEEDEKKIKATGHVETDMADVAATCEKEGSQGGKKCETCDEILEEPTSIAKLEHNYVESVSVNAACNASGTKTFTCENCNNVYDESYDLPTYTASEIHDLAKNSVCEITTYDKQGNGLSLGSGFVYTSDGQFVTNYHVIERAYSIKLSVNGKTYDVTSVVAYSKDIDLAILKVTTTDTFTSLPVCEIEHSTGSNIYALGSSQGFTDTFSQGIITNSRREENGVVHIQHSASISSGNSGGPLINEYCEVIGINTWVYIGSGGVAQNLNFAVAVSEIKNLTVVNYTVPQLYEAEFDAYTILRDYIVQNGKYDAEDNEYSFNPYYQNYKDHEYVTYIWYEASTNTFTYAFSMDYAYTIYLQLDANFSGSYEWYYWDDYDQYMEGYVYGSTFNNGTLSVSDYDLVSSSTYTSTLNLASTLMHSLCSRMDIDFASLGISAQDFGFVNY